MLETKIIADQMAGRAADTAAGTAAYAGWYPPYYNSAPAILHPNAFAMVAPAATRSASASPKRRVARWGTGSRSIAHGMIDNYQCIVASQWNAGPRDGNGGRAL